MKPEEVRLVKACQHRSEWAYKQFYNLFASKMLGVCMRYARTRDVAQDILHEGFLRIFANLDKIENVDSLEAWTRRVMVNTAINYVRDLHDNIVLESSEIPEKEDENCYDLFDMEVLVKAIQALPDNYRMVFNLYEIEGYSHQEIAERLHIQVSTSRSLLHRAKQRLQELLGNKEDYIR